MHAVAIIAMVVGVIGFGLAYMGTLDVVPLTVWGALAGVGALVTVLTRRPGN